MARRSPSTIKAQSSPSASPSRTGEASSPQALLRVGIIGCGSMGAIHAACFHAMAESEVVAYYNPTRSKAEALAARYGGRVFDDAAALAAWDGLDVVAVCSPQTHHFAQIMAAIEAGHHVYCEKPVALTAAELDAIEAAVAAAGVHFVTGHQMRFHPVIQAVRAAMPQLGACFHLDLEWSFRIAGHEGRCWMSYREGGFFMELGCHAADLARLLFGEVVHVSGQTLRLNPQRITEDHTNALLQFESGAVAHLLVSANARTERQGMLRGRVLGEKGRIDFRCYPYGRACNDATLTLDHGKEVFIADTTKTKLKIRRAKSHHATFPGFYDVYEQQAAAFLETVLRGAPPACSLHDGRKAVEIVLATYHQQGLASATRNFANPPPAYLADGSCHPLLER